MRASFGENVNREPVEYTPRVRTPPARQDYLYVPDDLLGLCEREDYERSAG
jgi:hypothetical protein